MVNDMANILIREATPEDAALILHFITGLAIYEKAEHEVLATESDIYDSLFGKDATAYGLISSQEDEPIGYAV